MPRLSQAEVARVRARLENENRITTAEAAKLLGVKEFVLIRWIVQGRRGKRLDGVHDPEGWFTSREAVERFQERNRQALAG